MMYHSSKSSALLLRAELKFLFIPLAFVLLRLGSMLMVVLYVYMHISMPPVLSTALLYASVSKMTCTHACMQSMIQQ